MKNTLVSSVLVEYNGQSGGFDITITHLPEDASEHEVVKEYRQTIQGVGEVIRDFRIKWNL